MLIIGRITKDAVVNKAKTEKQVVSFSITVNDWYKSKASEQPVKITTFFNCSYWRNAGIAGLLKKGAVVELIGRVSANIYTNAQGETKGALRFHVNSIKIHHSKTATTETDAQPAGRLQTEDLPF